MNSIVANMALHDDGLLPVNADIIEQALSKLWDQTIAAKQAETMPVKLTLATILIIASSECREQAEALAGELASIEPSRIISVYIDDEGNEYSASVRNACSRRQDDGSIICWEMIDILASHQHAGLLPGALRSLIPSSVPVVTIDLREYQGTPTLDQVLQEESNYYLVRARIVPSMPKSVSYLTFDWYQSHAVRELISMVYSEWSLAGSGLRLIEISDQPEVSELGQLLLGWFVSRGEQAGGRITSHGSTVTLRLYDRPIEIVRFFEKSGDGPLVRLTTEALTISVNHETQQSADARNFRGPRATAVVHESGQQHNRTFRGLDLGHYLIRATKNHAEFADFQKSQSVLRQYQLQA